MSKLSFLNSWGKVGNYFTRRSAQSVLNANQMAFAAASCGSSCGSDDDAAPASACGAGDDEKPSACGSSCGAGDDK